MTIDQIVQVTRSKYFTAAFRVAVLAFSLLTTCASGVIAYVVFDTRTKADAAVSVSTAVETKLQQRTQDNESFQASITGKVDDVATDVDKIRSDQLTMTGSVGRIEGILEQLQSQVAVTSWRAHAEN